MRRWPSKEREDGSWNDAAMRPPRYHRTSAFDQTAAFNYDCDRREVSSFRDKELIAASNIPVL